LTLAPEDLAVPVLARRRLAVKHLEKGRVLVSIRKRQGVKRTVYVVDYRDGSGRRRWETCKTREDAKNVAALKQLQAGQLRPATVLDPNISVKDYGARWLETLALSVKPRTRDVYTSLLNTHVLPAIGNVRLRQLHQAQIRALLAQRLEAGRSPATVRLMAAARGSMLAAAVDDSLLISNPTHGLRRKLRALRKDRPDEQDGPKALTSEQLTRFLAAVAAKAPGYATLFLLLARTGLRIGEAVALRWSDIDLAGRRIRVSRTMAPRRKDAAIDDRVGTPKSGRARTVDMSQALHDALDALRRARRQEALAGGWGQVPPWVFVNRNRRPFDASDIRTVFARVLKTTNLPEHLTPHSLRHHADSRIMPTAVAGTRRSARHFTFSPVVNAA